MNTSIWTSEIAQLTQAFRQHFGHLNEAELNWKSSPDRWSIAQNIDHLITINQTYYPIIQEVRAGTYQRVWLARFGFMVRFFGNFILKSIQPEQRKQKIKTFPIWEPSSSQIEGDILDRFEKHQLELQQFMRNCSDLLDQQVVIHSPANRNIVYTLERAFDIIVMHEKRHLEQAKEVLEQMKRGS